MRYFLPILTFWAMLPLSKAAEKAIEGGRSPDGKMEVVNVTDGTGGHFEIRDRGGKTLISEKVIIENRVSELTSGQAAEESISKNPFEGWAGPAEKVLWRADSQYVAIAFGTSPSGIDTAIFRLVNGLIEPYGANVEPYDPRKDLNGRGDTTHRLPYQWDDAGNLILKVTCDYGEKPEEELVQRSARIVCSMGGKMLDKDQRAQLKSWGITSYASQDEFIRMTKAYHPETFEAWQEKLTQIHPGMTLEEVKNILKPKEVKVEVALGSGILMALMLDDAYFVGSQFSPDPQKLIWIAEHPIATTYEVFGTGGGEVKRDEWLGDRSR